MNGLSAFLRPSTARFLIVSACTAKKRYSPPNQLTAEDLDNPSRRQISTARLRDFQLPAAEMYTGAGHIFVREAVDRLREQHFYITHCILSAGYGLLNEADVIVPYNVTFSGKPKPWIRESGKRLRLQETLVSIAREHDKVILILGREYLEALRLPLPTGELPPTLAYLAPSFAKHIGSGIETVSIGEAERRRIGAFSSSAKERRFQLDTYRAFGIDPKQEHGHK